MMIISNDIFTLGHIYKQGQKVLIYILYLVTLVGNNFLQYFCKSSAVLHNCHRTSCAYLPHTFLKSHSQLSMGGMLLQSS